MKKPVLKENETCLYTYSEGLTDEVFHYCPGCTHGIIHKLVAECLVEMDLQDKAIGVCPVGCLKLMDSSIPKSFETPRTMSIPPEKSV